MGAPSLGGASKRPCISQTEVVRLGLPFRLDGYSNSLTSRYQVPRRHEGEADKPEGDHDNRFHESLPVAKRW